MPRLVYLLLTFGLVHHSLLAQTPTLIKKISNKFYVASPIAYVGDKLYFSAIDSTNTSGIWQTDGTTEGTYRIKSILSNDPFYSLNQTNYDGRSGSGSAPHYKAKTILYFARVTNSVTELWRSDGTAPGTYAFKTLNQPFKWYLSFNLDGLLYSFVTNSNNVTELWRSDGSTSGTAIVKTFNHIGPDQDITTLNSAKGLLLFRFENDDRHLKEWTYQIWSSDGTGSGTSMIQEYKLKDGDNNYNSSSFDFTTVNDWVYFIGYDSVNGQGLWRTDGTAGGTYLVKAGRYELLIDMNGSLMVGDFDFNKDDPSINLSRSDGSGVTKIKRMEGYAGWWRRGYVAASHNLNLMYFQGINLDQSGTTNVYGFELFRSDGTADGTYMVKDVLPGVNFSVYVQFLIANNLLYFVTGYGTGEVLWRSDGTANGTYAVKNESPGYNSLFPDAKVATIDFTTLLVFSADSVNGLSLWRIGKGITPQHFHQATQNPSFKTRKLLAEHQNFKVCADGSEASVFKVSGGNQDYNLAEIRIQGATDVGSLSIIKKDKDSLVVRYKHPNDIQSPGASVTLVAGVYATPSSITALTTFDIILYRAPVLMTHGLWSGPESFSALETALTSTSLYPLSPSFIKRTDYSATNNREFAFNVPQIPVAINDLLGSLREAGVAAGKVDYVAHSMGGILGRLYLQRHKNYYDNIRRLITLNTPHSGSQLANLVRKPGDALSELTCNYIVKALFQNTGCNDGALTDLQVDSPAIRDSLNGSLRLNYRTVPSHTLATVDYNTPLDVITQALTKQIKTVAFYFARDVLTSTLFGDVNDWIVGRNSQTGGFMGNCTTLIENQSHLGSPANPNVISRVKRLLLESPASSSFCTGGFLPIPLNSAFPASSDVMATNLGTIQIGSPSRGRYVPAGSSLAITVNGTNLSEIRVLIDYNADTVYAARTMGTTASFTLKTDKYHLGRKTIVVIGKSQAGAFMADSSYFFLSDNFCESIQSGDWTDTSTWSCGREPTLTDAVTINPGHTITVSTTTAQAQRIIYNGGKLQFATGVSKVFIKGDG